MFAEISETELFQLAYASCELLQSHIDGAIKLDDQEIEARKYLIRFASSKCIYFFAKAVLNFDLLTEQTHKRWADDLRETFLKKKESVACALGELTKQLFMEKPSFYGFGVA